MLKPLFRTVLVLFCLFAVSAKGGDIAECLRDGSLWEKNVSENDQLRGVRGAKLDATSLRIGSGLRIGEIKIGETTMTIDEKNCPVFMAIMVYNKGDNGLVAKDEYDALVAETTAALNALTEVKGKLRRVSKKDTGVKLNAWQWEWEKGAARLEASASGNAKSFQPEFIRLKFAADADGLEKGGASDALGRFALKKNLKVEDSRHWIDGIPMVDQGQKGYCVPATLSRLFAYYGMDGVDQHAMAALCDSSSDQGTNPMQMEEALKKISSAFHVRLVKVETPSLLSIPTKSYNRVAKRLKKEEVDNLRMNLPLLDGEVLKEVQAGKPAQVNKWMTTVAKTIDTGIPLVWSVMLGYFPEPVAQSSGGHMRMIIGYDMEKKVILFSDSWGQGHELKSMPAAQAVAITMALYVLRPTR